MWAANEIDGGFMFSHLLFHTNQIYVYMYKIQPNLFKTQFINLLTYIGILGMIVGGNMTIL